MGKESLTFVKHCKYLGHIIAEDLSDRLDMEAQTRALYCRANTLARKFSQCTDDVKCFLFKMYCSNMYCSSLWSTYICSGYNRVKVAFNNSLRIMLRLPKFCSASNMFTSRRLENFEAQLRKQRFSLIKRVYKSDNCIVSVLVNSDVQHKSKLLSYIERTLHGLK